MQQQQQQNMLNAGNLQRQQRNRQETLLSMRKHRSLDGSQFLSQFENSPINQIGAGTSASAANPVPPPASSMYSNDMRTTNAYNMNRSPEYTNHPSYNPYLMDGQLPQYPQSSNSYNMQYSDDEIYGQQYLKNYPNYPPTQNSTYNRRAPSSMFAEPSYNNNDYEMLKRDFIQLNQRLNNVLESIRTFWSPELKKERQLRKEEAMRTNSLQYKLFEMVRNELEKREKDIGQLLSESDLNLVDMEEELRQLRKQFREPRDFTDQTLSLHEFQTMKAKMEKSELALAEKTRENQNLERERSALEIRLKCAEDQHQEMSKHNEILQRSNLANEAQIKLLNDDLNVLRKKLETKNQLLETREKKIKNLEKELDSLKIQMQESSHVIQVCEITESL